jgi:hypothetical protein
VPQNRLQAARLAAGPPTNQLDALTRRQLQEAIRRRAGGRQTYTAPLQDKLDAAAMGTMMVPGVGDVAGLGADAHRFATDPASRTWTNYGLSALGALPFVPPMVAMTKAGGWYSRIKPDDLPLTGTQRGQLETAAKQSFKKAPGKLANDLIEKGLWPEELRGEAVGYLTRRVERSLARGDLRRSRPDLLAIRKPGHAQKSLALSKRLDVQRAQEEAAKEANRALGTTLLELDPGGLWNAKFADDVEQSARMLIDYSSDYGALRSVALANMEAVPRALKKKGWTVRHASKSAGGRKGSRYVVSPDGTFEVRLSDHPLPDTPQRQHNQDTFGTRWSEEIVLTGRESPQQIIDDIEALYQDMLD